MLTRIIALARRISPGMNQALVRLWYHYLAVADKEAHLLFMNYGYADLQPDAEALALSEVDERGHWGQEEDRHWHLPANRGHPTHSRVTARVMRKTRPGI